MNLVAADVRVGNSVNGDVQAHRHGKDRLGSCQIRRSYSFSAGPRSVTTSFSSALLLSGHRTVSHTTMSRLGRTPCHRFPAEDIHREPTGLYRRHRSPAVLP